MYMYEREREAVGVGGEVDVAGNVALVEMVVVAG